MNDPTKARPFNCHAEAPSGETILYSVINRNHCQEVHVATSQFKGFWDAVGNWVRSTIDNSFLLIDLTFASFFCFLCFFPPQKYAHYARGECPPQFNTKDSIKPDVNWPTAIVIKKGIATSFLRKDPTNGNECCGVPCDDTSQCSANMFCCPNHHECMDSSTQSTEGPNCDAARDNGCQSSGTATAVMKLLRGGGVATLPPAPFNTCKGPIQSNLRYNISSLGHDYITAPVAVNPTETLADAICCDSRVNNYAEPRFLFQSPYVNLYKEMNAKGVTNFYDAQCGLLLFTAPVGRTAADFQGKNITATTTTAAATITTTTTTTTTTTLHVQVLFLLLLLLLLLLLFLLYCYHYNYSCQ